MYLKTIFIILDNKLAIVADKFEETKTYIYELSNNKGLDNEKVFDATSINMKEYGLYGTTGTRLPMFGKNVEGILESIAWHPNEENVLFVSCSLEGRSNHVYFQAKNVEDSETLFDYKYFDRPKLAIGKKMTLKNRISSGCTISRNFAFKCICFRIDLLFYIFV